MDHFLGSGLPAALELQRAWEHMQHEVDGCSKGGPLSEPIGGRASRVRAHLQKEITKHREVAAAERLTKEMKELMRQGAWGQIRPGDLRANAYLSCDKLSSQFLLALSNKHYFLEPTAFSDALARYLGAPLPSIVRGGLQGLPMPCNALSGEGRRRGRMRSVMLTGIRWSWLS